VILGFPSNQFGGQEPGTDEEIASFCELNHGVTFPLMTKSDVNGDNTNEVYKWYEFISTFSPLLFFSGCRRQPRMGRSVLF
jgi:glutathione peroxidase-family protein